MDKMTEYYHRRQSPISGFLIILLLALSTSQFVHVTSAQPSPSSSSSRPHQQQQQRPQRPPISTKHGISKIVQNRLENAHELAMKEQEVENYNAELIASATTAQERYGHRRLIALPIDEGFDPPIMHFGHGHIQTSDKVSVPSCFLRTIKLVGPDPPYMINVKRIDGVTSEPRVDVSDDLAYEQLDEVMGTPLDYRSPENYVFLPWWMMRSLGLRPRDVVDVSLIAKTDSIPLGSHAKFRPHSKEFSKHIANAGNVLEMELRHYLVLTKGSTIAFDYNGKRYWFDVVELKSAPKGVKAKIVRTMDSNLATDFLPAKDEKKKNNK
eukprot:CAMPEP_0113519500 /NCGR_PEP_ID=MMETSP0014_2-20120614/43553_1 /TAXON_ID=2857 /ORGANISM="Nitzschia sp." /LENGTH=323 /DNA_ID=CAMNT_0000417223 /DNA_START=12 /DNA_END=983 /DNA_ORIENTATION=- /assembly_acc=CAM_ASM_000159